MVARVGDGVGDEEGVVARVGNASATRREWSRALGRDVGDEENWSRALGRGVGGEDGLGQESAKTPLFEGGGLLEWMALFFFKPMGSFFNIVRILKQ